MLPSREALTSIVPLLRPSLPRFRSEARSGRKVEIEWRFGFSRQLRRGRFAGLAVEAGRGGSFRLAFRSSRSIGVLVVELFDRLCIPIVDRSAQAELGCFLANRARIPLQLRSQLHYALIRLLPAFCRSVEQGGFQ